MLSENRRQRYQKFQQALEGLQSKATQGNLDRAALLADYKQVQDLFGNELMQLGSEELEPPTTQREQSYLTEIHKQLRLLGMDVTFLQASRQLATTTSRQGAACNRINILIDYCSALLQPE